MYKKEAIKEAIKKIIKETYKKSYKKALKEYFEEARKKAIDEIFEESDRKIKAMEYELVKEEDDKEFFEEALKEAFKEAFRELTEGCNKNSKLKIAIERAKKGEFSEYWLQEYIEKNYKKLGFKSINRIFKNEYDFNYDFVKTSYDFEGIYKGKKVIVEAERRVKDFIYHRHNPKEVDILIVLNDEINEDVLGMKPAEWKKLLPKKIIKVDPEDFVKSIYEMLKEYTIKKKEELESLKKFMPRLKFIKGALTVLWMNLVGGTPYKWTPERVIFDEALTMTAIKYLRFYKWDQEMLEYFINKPEVGYTRIEGLASELMGKGKDLSGLPDEDKEFIENWLDVLRKAYEML